MAECAYGLEKAHEEFDAMPPGMVLTEEQRVRRFVLKGLLFRCHYSTPACGWQPPERVSQVRSAEALGGTAGQSTCPICNRHWTVTMFDDCMLPACGHYGEDTSEANPARTCETCGMLHAAVCPEMPGRARD